MSFFGKLLIVFQVLFSFVFMAFAGAVYTAQVNWKSKADALQEQMNTANQQASEQATLWQTDRSALENQANDLQSKFQTAQADFNNAKNELDGLQRDYDQLKTIEKVFEAESGL